MCTNEKGSREKSLLPLADLGFLDRVAVLLQPGLEERLVLLVQGFHLGEEVLQRRAGEQAEEVLHRHRVGHQLLFHR